MKSFILSISVVALLLTGCGGGGGSSDGTTTASTATTTITGTVPGTLIEAFCTDGTYASVHSINNNTSKHPFSITIPKNIDCRLVMTTNENDATNKIVTPIRIIVGNTSTALFKTSGDSIGLGNIPLEMSYANITDTNNDHIPDNNFTIAVNNSSLTPRTIANDATDSNGDGIPNAYEIEKDNNGKDIFHKDNIASNKSNNDLDGDGITNEADADIDNDGILNKNDNDNDNDGILNKNDSDDDNDGILDVNDNDNISTNNTATAGSTGAYTLLAWNDLGMHCFDGSDFSVFSILPPYNNLNAHLIKKDGTSNKHITTGVTLTYESLTYKDHTNKTHTNTKSSTKTNFWDYLTSLFPGKTSVKDIGLTGNKTPSTIPHTMTYNSTNNWFEATAIPLINRDDNNATNYYPMVRVVAKNTAGTILATADVVLPVSDEMDCAKCHASTVASTDARPNSGWENNTDVLKDYKLNILKLHDEKVGAINSADLTALKAKGYDYNSSLYDTAKSGTPILCAACHSSTALSTTSIGNATALTTALHHKHASVIDPSNGLTLNSSSNRDSCYSCHPGAATECLRGAMGSAKNADGTSMMQCQSCHGTMNDIGNSNRIGWMDEPNCQVCHQNGQRYSSALVNGSLRAVLDTKFATNPNTPSAGVSLYRFSTGHGDLQCSSCHGSTHAIFPSSHAEDNVISNQIQGHSGTIAECTSCHTTMPSTTTGGPHGMHTVGQSWVSTHQDVAEHGGAAACTTCHGADYRGSVLSKTFSARTLSGKTYSKGQMVSCYDCHNGPNGE